MLILALLMAEREPPRAARLVAVPLAMADAVVRARRLLFGAGMPPYDWSRPHDPPGKRRPPDRPLPG